MDSLGQTAWTLYVERGKYGFVTKKPGSYKEPDQ